MEKQTADGWQSYLPYGQRVAHYFRMEDKGTSLCGRVGFFNSETELGRGSNDCAACTKKLDKLEGARS